MKRTDPKLVYYGPYICRDTQTPRKRGNTGCNARIVKAGNQVAANLEFNAQPEDSIIYPNTHPTAKWTPHKCKAV